MVIGLIWEGDERKMGWFWEGFEKKAYNIPKVVVTKNLFEFNSEFRTLLIETNV